MYSFSPEKIHRIAAEILTFLREEALTKFPAFPEAFGRLSPRIEETLPAAFGTDGSFLFYHPQRICEEFLHDTDALRKAYLHVHLHCLCFHILKPKAVSEQLWNRACDLCTELFLLRFYPDQQQKALFAGLPNPEELPLSAASLLPLLEKNKDLYRIAEGCARDTHVRWFQEATLLTHLEHLKKKWAIPFENLQNGSSKGQKMSGLSGGSASEYANLVKKDSMDYRTFLRQFTVAREEPVLDCESFDYIPYHFGLTYYQNMPFIEPLEYREVNRLDELAIAIDTSGSCSGKIVRRFLEETWSILRQRENFFSRMRLHLIQCDSIIQEYRMFTSVQEWEEALPEFKILGHGNTDFCPVFDLLDRMIEKKEIRHLRGLLYFTDGDGIFPRSAPSYDTAFVFLNDRLEKQKIPDWALRLNLNLPEDFS